MGNVLAHKGAAQSLRYAHWLPVGAAFLLWLVPSLDIIHKYTGQAGLLALSVIALASIFALTAIARRRGPIPPSGGSLHFA